MTEHQPPPPMPDLSSFRENQNNIPDDELARYFGKYVAWSTDGTRIVVSGEDWEDLFDRLAEAGVDLNTVVLDYVDSPDEVRV
jgi:hypothetical protein